MHGHGPIESVLTALALILALGIGAQWLAWRLRWPSILVLLAAGLLAGPVFGLIEPDPLFGRLLFPFISLSVGLILYEGGLSLRMSEIEKMGRVPWNLVTVGVGVTWVVATGAAYALLRFTLPEALLLGAVLVVTGPTVVLPLLRQIRPIGQVAPILKWEGIVNDPIGVMLAVLVFEALLASSLTSAPAIMLLGVLKTLLVGLGIGSAAAWLLLQLLKRHLIPDQLQNAISLTMVLVAFTLSDIVQRESGLLTATVMGFMLANQSSVPVRHIVEFKEDLRVLLLAVLFIVLAGRIDLAVIEKLPPATLAFVAILILVARPLAVLASTWRSGLNLRERFFLSWMAPRGIVAAAMSSVFAVRLEEAGYANADLFAPVVFAVILVTVSVYGLSGAFVAARLRLAQSDPQGCLILGAHPLARAIARTLRDEGIPVLLVDNNRSNVVAARMEGLAAHQGDILAEHIRNELDLTGIGRLLALTANDQVNALASLHFQEEFGRADVYQLAAAKMKKPGIEIQGPPRHLRGRYLFRDDATFAALTQRFADGATIKLTRLTPDFTFDRYKKTHGDRALPLFIVPEHGRLRIIAVDEQPAPQAGHRLISLVAENGDAEPAATR